MGEAIPRQNPSVVLRSHFNQLRALLAVALIAVAGLTVAVVILANDDDQAPSTSSVAKPIGSIAYGNSSVNPSTGYPAVPLSQLDRPLQNRIDGIRYDGGPEEGTRGIARDAQPSVSPETQVKDEAGTAAAIGQANSSSATETKDEAASAAAIGQASGGSELRGSKASQWGTSQYRFAQP